MPTQIRLIDHLFLSTDLNMENNSATVSCANTSTTVPSVDHEHGLFIIFPSALVLSLSSSFPVTGL